MFIQRNILIEVFLAFPSLEVYVLGVNETNVCEKDTCVRAHTNIAFFNVRKKTRILINRLLNCITRGMRS